MIAKTTKTRNKKAVVFLEDSGFFDIRQAEILVDNEKYLSNSLHTSFRNQLKVIFNIKNIIVKLPIS